MRGKNGTRPRGLSIGSESMCLFSDDPLMQGLALFGNGGLLLSHTPPNFTPGSYEVSHMKRARAGSISGRLRSASDLEEKGLIDKSQKGVLKDLIISGDAELQAALDLYEGGDDSQLQALMERGMLDRRDSLDLLQDLDLDFGIMDLAVSNEVGVGASTGSSDGGAQSSGPPAPSEAASGEVVVGEIGAAMSRNSTRSGGAGGEETFAAAALAGAGGGAKARVSPLRRGDGAGVASNSFAEGGGGGGPVGTRGHLQQMQPQHQQSEDGGDESEHEIDLGCDSTCQFDIGDMAFDTAFEHDYAGHHEDDVDMKDQVTVDCASPPSTAKKVGPLRVVANSKLPIHLVPSGADDVDDEGHHRTGGGSGAGGLGGVMTGPGEDSEHGHGHAGADGGVDGDAPELGSFGTMAAVIGDFSPQFKFSFTDDIHLDLGGGLKDELRDLESFSDPLPDQPGKVGDILGLGAVAVGVGGPLSGARAQQLLSRGGPSVKLESSFTATSRLGSGSGSVRSDPFSSDAARMSSPDVATREDYDEEDDDDGDEDAAAAAEASVAVGFTSNHYSSGAAYNVRRGGSYATNTRSATGAERAAAGLRRQDYQVRGAREVPTRSAYGREGATVAAGQRYGGGGASSTPHHAARGRPVVSGMEIMVGDGPRTGLSMGGSGVDGEQKKFVGAYSPEARRQRVQRFLQKREHRVWTKMVKYDVRKNFADTRMRVKGRFVKKEDEALLREVMACA